MWWLWSRIFCKMKALTEPTALPAGLWLLSPSVMPMRRHFILTAVGPQCLLIPLQEPGRCPPVALYLALPLPTVHRHRQSPKPSCRDSISLPRGWGQGPTVGLHGTHQGFLSIRATFPGPWSPRHHCLPFSALTSPWGGLDSNVPQWDR